MRSGPLNKTNGTATETIAKVLNLFIPTLEALNNADNKL